MKIMTYNVNGLRARIKDGTLDITLRKLNPDIICIQETKCLPEQVKYCPPGWEGKKYTCVFHSTDPNVKKGYAGTAIYSKLEPINVMKGFGAGSLWDDKEGRVLTFEYKDFYLVCAYVINSKPNLARIGDRTTFENAMLVHLKKLDAVKPVIYCGDLNIARNPIDVYDAKIDGIHCYSEPERQLLNRLLSSGFTDVYRALHPNEDEIFTWWDARQRAREGNRGLRIDYFIVSNRLMGNIADCEINQFFGSSDHCPVTLITK